MILGSVSWANPGAKLTQVAGLHEENTHRNPGNLEMPAISPMLAEIQAVMDSTRVLEAILRESYGEDESDDLQLAIAELKKASRLQILDIQLRFAHEEGRTELARRIRASIEDLQRPAAPGSPGPAGGFVDSPPAVRHDR
jgi:hypothetical protein